MADEGYTIRAAQFDELSLLGEIERAAGRRFAEIGLARVAEFKPVALDFLQSQQCAGQVWVAADAGDRPVGFAVTGEFDGALYIEEISVHPAHGRRGLGRRLIEALSQWAKLQGFPSILLSTFRDVPWNAPFYEKIGFRILDESEMSAALSEVYREDSRQWLPLARVCMRREL